MENPLRQEYDKTYQRLSRFMKVYEGLSGFIKAVFMIGRFQA
jgi:hypothetical protein